MTVGRLTRQKRIHVIIAAVASLHARGRPVALTIVGDGPERAPLEEAVRRAALTAHVRFTGAVAPAQVAGLLGGADVFAFPARHEGFGLAAAEALMAGVPIVVADDGGGVLDVAAPGAAIVVSGTDPLAWATAMARMMDDAHAPAAATAAGEQWRTRLRPSVVAERLEAVLEGACRQE